ncbi:ABC transporter substrate-binding protein [Pseudomonas sp. NFR16]|uniref:ABC transporter substrate-binding protein n=1 Tax=Pseudomonas sp. NFR16 TaxID=1566248 RepID=UPI0008C7E26B|nr:ABC transporter substrate-binding protein [Pseudomonas sp. NFR16]SEI52217.1 peptide/nickel transport system substrate-binding protein [Pseudomonas sp. NFR16]
MPFSRRQFIAGLSALPLLGASVPFLPSALAAATAEAVSGRRIFNLLVNPEPPSLSSFNTTAGTTITASSKVLEGLLRYDENLTPQPGLAVAWEAAADGLSYRFTLRQGVKWHDGQPFTAQDVAFSLDLNKRYHPRGGSTFANLLSVETPDDHTAIVRLGKPAPYLIRAFAGSETPIVPKHLYASGDPLSNPHNNAPVGTGPYRFKQWQRGSFIEYERNPDYWDSSLPGVDALFLKVVPDSAARLAAFENGSLDAGGQSPVPLSDLKRITQSGKLQFTTRGYAYSITPTMLEFNLDNPLLARHEVRQAIAHAIDREVIRKVVYYGYADVSVSPIPKNFAQYVYEGPDPYPFDIARANALLDAAGLPRKGPSRFSLTLDPLPYGDSYARTAAYIRTALARIGIDVQLRSQDFPTYTKRIYTDRDFDFAVVGMGTMFDPTVGVQRLFWSKNFRKGLPFSNGSHYNNPEVDRLLEAAAVETDEHKRGEFFKAFQKIVIEELPNITLVMQQQVTVFNARVSGFEADGNGLDGSLADVRLGGEALAHG